MLSLRNLNDQRDLILNERAVKSARDQIDIEAYRIEQLNRARMSDTEYAANQSHKRRLEEMQATTDCQVKLQRSVTAGNVNAAIMNNHARFNINGEEEEE